MKARAHEYPGRILIIEDDDAIREMLHRIFEPHCEVVLAKDGLQALSCFREMEPDFVITDLMLPGMRGVELIRRARRTHWGACVPILVVTADASEDALLECFREGADDFVVKPFSMREIRTRVSSIYLRQEVARDVNPLTRMPGNLVLKREMQRRLQDGENFALATLDIDHFKPFNDARGFDAGDEVIKILSDTLVAWARKTCERECFVGHVGGDDFVAILPLDEVNGFARHVHERFSERIVEFYSNEERERGLTTIRARTGDLLQVPLLSISIGVVYSHRVGKTVNQLGQCSAEVKKVAKAIPGNSLFVDRRNATQDL